MCCLKTSLTLLLRGTSESKSETGDAPTERPGPFHGHRGSAETCKSIVNEDMVLPVYDFNSLGRCLLKAIIQSEH